MGGKRKTYDLEFKLEVIKYGEETNNREAGRKFSVDESMVRRWRKNVDIMQEQASSSAAESKKKRLHGAGRKPVLGDLEKFLLDKITEERENGRSVSCKLMTTWARELAAEHNLREFQASRGWLCNFMKRNQISLKSWQNEEKHQPSEHYELGEVSMVKLHPG